MKHVLAISTLYPNPVHPRFGTFVARSLEALAARGDWRVTVVNPIGIPPVAVGRYRALSQLDDMAVEHGITVHRPQFSLIPKIGARRNASAIAKAVLPVARTINAEHPIDIVDAQFFFPDGPAAAQIAEALGKPLSIKARGSDITHWGNQQHIADQIRSAADAATGLLSVSRALARDMANLGLPDEKITVHYTGLDRDRFRPLDHTQLRSQITRALNFKLPDNAPFLLSVGALIERKGQAYVVEALPDIPGARLVLVGKGEDEERLRHLAQAKGVADRVHFAGSIDHDLLPLLLSAADVMVLPTASEGLANAWVESLACGTPVVTSDVGGARELITSDTAGRLLADRSAKSVAEAVTAILNAPPETSEVAAFAEHFSWENNAAELAAHYERLLTLSE